MGTAGDRMRIDEPYIKITETEEHWKGDATYFDATDFKILALAIHEVQLSREEYPATLKEVPTEELDDLQNRCIKAADILARFKK